MQLCNESLGNERGLPPIDITPVSLIYTRLVEPEGSDKIHSQTNYQTNRPPRLEDRQTNKQTNRHTVQKQMDDGSSILHLASCILASIVHILVSQNQPLIPALASRSRHKTGSGLVVYKTA